jgi:hypothetical protein
MVIKASSKCLVEWKNFFVFKVENTKIEATIQGIFFRKQSIFLSFAMLASFDITRNK